MQGCDVRVGPDSVGHQLQQEALAFGGTTVTATDIAMVTGLLAPFGDASVPDVTQRMLPACRFTR